MNRREFLRVGGVAMLAATSPTQTAQAVPDPGASGWYDVREFGARGDGRVDDTAPISAAIGAALRGGGGVVWVPPGVYLTSTQRIGGGITFQGAGWQSILRLLPGTKGHLIETPAAQASYFAVVRDLCLDGNRDHNTAGDVLHLFSATNFRLEGLRVMNAARHGIALSGDEDSPTIAPWIVDSCILSCSGNGIDVAGSTTDCKIRSVDIGWCDKGVVLPNSSFLSDVTIWQCNTGLLGYWAANSHLHLVRTERCNYSGFWFEGCRDTSIEQCRSYENNQSRGSYHGFQLTGSKSHPTRRLSFVGCMSGLAGSRVERQLFGFSDGGSKYVDYIITEACTAAGNLKGGYRLGGAHNKAHANL